MNAQFTNVADRANHTLRVTMSGFFQQADVEAFLRDIRMKLDQLRCGPNEHLMLCDARGMSIQMQHIVQSFAGIVGDPQLRSKRLAFVNGTSLSRLQTRRLTDREGVAFFNNMKEAETWLIHGSDQPAGSRPAADR